MMTNQVFKFCTLLLQVSLIEGFLTETPRTLSIPRSPNFDEPHFLKSSSTSYLDALNGRRGIDKDVGELNAWARTEDSRRLASTQRELERAVERRLESVDRLEETLDRRLDALAEIESNRKVNRDGINYRPRTDSGYYRRSVRDRDDSPYYNRNSWRSTTRNIGRDVNDNNDFRNTWSSGYNNGRGGYASGYGSSTGFRDWSRDQDRYRYRDGRSSWDGASTSRYGTSYDRSSLYEDRYRYGDTGRYRDRYGYSDTGSRSYYDDPSYGTSLRDDTRGRYSWNRDRLIGPRRYDTVRDRDYGYYSQGLRSGNVIRKIWETSKPTIVQGGSLITWSFAKPDIEWLHVLLKSEGRPLDADIQLWHGPDNIPQRMQVYVEDANSGTFSAFLGTPRIPSTVAIRNTGQIEFPLTACVGPDYEASFDCLEAVQKSRSDRIQGGALVTYPFGPSVGSVLVYLETDGRPLNTRIELLQGPNHNKQILDVYTEDGLYRPFMAVIQTPGAGNVVRVVNTAPVEFPMTATVVPYETASLDSWGEDGVILGRNWRR